MPETTCDFYPNNPNNPSKMAIIRPKTAESRGYLAQISEFGNGNFWFFLVQPIATHPCCFGGHFGVFNFCSCSCCSRRTPKMRCVFANATFTGWRATARSHENRSRGGVLSCRVRWHMQGGMRVPYHARAPQQHEQRTRFGHCQEDRPNAETRVALSMRLIPGRGRSNGISSNVKEERQDDNSIGYSVGPLVTY